MSEPSADSAEAPSTCFVVVELCTAFLRPGRAAHCILWPKKSDQKPGQKPGQKSGPKSAKTLLKIITNTLGIWEVNIFISKVCTKYVIYNCRLKIPYQFLKRAYVFFHHPYLTVRKPY